MAGTTIRIVRHLGVKLVAGGCIILQATGAGLPEVSAASPTRLLSAAQALQPSISPSASSVQVNRMVPQVEPPRTRLEFSAQPTAVELFRAHVFEEPLVPVGGEPDPAETAALAAALLGYSQRQSPDDFSSLAQFISAYPQSPWRSSLLLNLGLEYYNTAHYSLALESWSEAWSLAKDATDPPGKAVGDRTAGELAYMYARIGRMTALDSLLQSVESRVFLGPATERISGARAGLDNMKHRPEIAFRCGPLALRSIQVALDLKHPGNEPIFKSASTQKGFSLPQVAELSKQAGLNYQMAFREKGRPFIAPSVVHWKVGHYAALIRQEGDRYLLKDPTFQNDVWATREALEAETSGYFLIPPGRLPLGWRAVEAKEGGDIWGKGNTCCNDPNPNGCRDPKKQDGSCDKHHCKGMAVASVHLMLVSLNIVDQPVGYTPPVGPELDFTVTYNHREANQPSIFSYSNFGSKWTFDWLSYITDNPFSPSADVKYFIMGGGTRIFSDFDANTQAYAWQQFDQTRLTRTSSTSYEMLSPDGSRKIFAQSDGSTGTSRKIFLTQLIDPAGNAVALTYDSLLRVVASTDAIGQVTTLSYQDPIDLYKITRVTDPFGRSATFDYDAFGRLVKMQDVLGLTSQFTYDPASDYVNSLITPYGTNTFLRGESGTTRWLETIYPNGEHDRVEYNQSTTLGVAASVLPAALPVGMTTHNDYLYFRNSYYWSRIAYATAYPDYTKAKIYHWVHTVDQASTSGILESVKEPLEGRVWYDYAGQSDSIFAGVNNQPTHVGRVLDDGTTQLYTYEYDGFGHVTKSIDPLGRTLAFLYSTNGIDLLETRQIRAGNNELLLKSTYNSQHLPLTKTDASGQTTVYNYNAHGQVLSETNAKGERTTYAYDTNGYLISVDGPLPGADDTTTWTYDPFGRVRTKTDVSGYRLTFDYDALDRLTQITRPDSTFDQLTYTRLDLTLVRDRAGRQTAFDYNSIRQMTKRTDPLGRVTLFQWCKCGDAKSLTDPMGRTTSWHHDLQGRVTSKEFPDGSQITYVYENTTSRVRQRIDEQLQVTEYSYYNDDMTKGVSYANTAFATPAVAFTYDLNYYRLASIKDGYGTTLYNYYPITGAATLGGGKLARTDGPLPHETLTFAYDELGRRVSTAINGVTSTLSFDAAGRVVSETNALGSFSYTFEGSSFRRASEVFPGGQTAEITYGGNLQDHWLQRVTYKTGNALLSDFIYGRDVPRGLVTSCSQQFATQAPLINSFGYDAADQLMSASLTNGAGVLKNFAYRYDPAGNRLSEQIDATTNAAGYNALNQLTALKGTSGNTVAREWDAEQRLTAVSAGNQRTEFTYDGLGRLLGIRQVVSGSEVSNRWFVWSDDQICEEHTTDGGVTKRFFVQGMRVEKGAAAGNYYYTRDHIGSVCELTDGGGNVRARYSYDPFGLRTKVAGDLDTDLGFAGMFWTSEAGLNLTRFRAYDPKLGRWLSRDKLRNAELEEGENLYAYVRNDPVNQIDPLGLCCENEKLQLLRQQEDTKAVCDQAIKGANDACNAVKEKYKYAKDPGEQTDVDKWVGLICAAYFAKAALTCSQQYFWFVRPAKQHLEECLQRPCNAPCK